MSELCTYCAGELPEDPCTCTACDACPVIACPSCQANMVRDAVGHLCRPCRAEYEARFPGTYVGDQYGNRVRLEDEDPTLTA